MNEHSNDRRNDQQVLVSAEGSTSYWHGLHELTRVLDGEWIPAILATLARGPRHFTEILTEIQCTGTGQPDPKRRLHDSILGRTLRRMEENGLITRDELTATFPKSTVYELTTWATMLLSGLIPAVYCTTEIRTRIGTSTGYMTATARAC
ncbi:HxlR-like helix-turn-helix [Actinokineospora alba]|uniref:HxlR-like helix-turn-helix n=1 Tax=Actinokineospora alba TaxID=504798 RepID=A0A1H0LC43_9PSEU|nr:winged helix-turn-helix transcriptional regulator [Actinokineospora alba]TDP67265.1 HxlR family transcriptional regulator [Actinokineospora alba]SDJ02197.1 HxlR-like helix-turn-helix [Actinokineospora alba]SDO65561.1 HxlR-like helix-turn-helix [Actinokineospora alba]